MTDSPSTICPASFDIFRPTGMDQNSEEEWVSFQRETAHPPTQRRSGPEEHSRAAIVHIVAS